MMGSPGARVFGGARTVPSENDLHPKNGRDVGRLRSVTMVRWRRLRVRTAVGIGLLLLPFSGWEAHSSSAARKYVTGLIVSHDKGRFVVLGAVPGSPAARSDLRQGDVIVEINGKSTDGLPFKQGLQELSGKRPKQVTLLVDRDSQRLGFALQREALESILDREGLRVDQDSLVPKLARGDQVPEIEGWDLYTDAAIRLERFRGSYVLLVFWASWCGSCKNAVELLAESQPCLADQLVMIGISVDEKTDDMERFLRTRRFCDYQIHDGGWFGKWSRSFQVYRSGIPWGVLVGTDGRIVDDGPVTTVLPAAKEKMACN
jgi:thiol-disulfide isomerase/thioredoxin